MSTQPSKIDIGTLEEPVLGSMTPQSLADGFTEDIEGDSPVADAKTPTKGDPTPAPISTKANMLWNSAGSLTYLACQWLTTIFVVRLAAGYDDAGLLSLAMAIVGTFSTFANYAMNTYQISDIRHENDVGEYLAFRGITFGGAFVACIIYTAITSPMYALSTVALFFLFKGASIFIDVLHALDQQHRRMDYNGRSFMLQGVGTLGAFVLVFGTTQNLNLAIVAMMGITIVVLIGYDIPRARQFESLRIHLTRKKAWYFLKTSCPAVLASLSASALFTIPKQYLIFASGDAALGIYASVSAPAMVIQMGAVYLYGPLLDLFARHYFDRDVGGFMRLLGRIAAGIAGICVGCALILEFLGAWILQLLFGQSIVPYVYLLQPVILMTALTAFIWLFSDLMIAVRNFRGNLIGNVVALVAVVPLSVVCVNYWDMNGVSFASIGACVVGVILLFIFLLHTVRRGPLPPKS